MIAAERSCDHTLQPERFSIAAQTPNHIQLHFFTDTALANIPDVQEAAGLPALRDPIIVTESIGISQNMAADVAFCTSGLPQTQF